MIKLLSVMWRKFSLSVQRVQTGLRREEHFTTKSGSAASSKGWVILGLILSFLGTIQPQPGFAQGNLLQFLPGLVKDRVEVLDDFSGDLKRWSCSPDISLSRSSVVKTGRNSLQIKYAAVSGEVIMGNDTFVNFLLPETHLTGERLRFWLKGNDSQDRIRVSCYYQKSSSWLPLADILLDFPGWKHLEIPASNPIYYYYPSVTNFKFQIIRGADSKADKSLYLDGFKLVSPQVVELPLEKKTLPAPIFSSWGGPTKAQIEAGAKIGVTLHITPMGFPTGERPEFINQAEFVGQRARWCKENGMLAGLHFYNNPTATYAKNHADLFMKNFKGISYYDYYPAESALSPWHPAVQKFWRGHIVSTLTYLKEHNLLQYIDVIFLSPGEEGELCYQWDYVWAFDDYAVSAYRDYLKRLYKDIVVLNRDWSSAYTDFNQVMPPSAYYPDREHWVFADFYRWSMLKWSVQLADAVREVFEPKYWLWMPHTIPDYPQRYNSARYPHFYAENLKKLGIMDFAHLAALDWQGKEDVEYVNRLGVRTIGEIDVLPTKERLQWTFDQSRKFGFEGVYIGVLEGLSSPQGVPSETGNLCQQLIKDFKNP